MATRHLLLPAYLQGDSDIQAVAMERSLTNFSNVTGMRAIYRVRIANLPRVEDAEQNHSVWDKLLGLATMIVVSAGGWTAIIELIRVLR